MPRSGTDRAALGRARHALAPEVVFLPHDGERRAVPHGCLWVVAGHGRSGLIQRSCAAAHAGDAARVAEILKGMEDLRRQTRMRTGGEPLHASGSTIEVSYDGTPIAAGSLSRDVRQAVCARLSFAGGTLRPERFTASVSVERDADERPVASAVIVYQPALSDLECRALRRLPHEMSRRGVAQTLDAGAPMARLLELRAELVLAGRLS